MIEEISQRQNAGGASDSTDLLTLLRNAPEFAPYIRVRDGFVEMIFRDESHYEKWITDDLTILRSNNDGNITGVRLSLGTEPQPEKIL